MFDHLSTHHDNPPSMELSYAMLGYAMLFNAAVLLTQVHGQDAKLVHSPKRKMGVNIPKHISKNRGKDSEAKKG